MLDIVFINNLNPSIVESSGKEELTAAAHEEIGAIIQIGAAVESITYANFSHEILFLSINGFITVPTVKQLK